MYINLKFVTMKNTLHCDYNYSQFCRASKKLKKGIH